MNDDGRVTMIDENKKVMSVSDWLVTMLVYAIPVVGFIMLFVWAFGGNGNENRANMAKAMLIWIAILMIFGVFILTLFGAAFWSGFY